MPIQILQRLAPAQKQAMKKISVYLDPDEPSVATFEGYDKQSIQKVLYGGMNARTRIMEKSGESRPYKSLMETLQGPYSVTLLPEQQIINPSLKLGSLDRETIRVRIDPVRGSQ